MISVPKCKLAGSFKTTFGALEVYIYQLAGSCEFNRALPPKLHAYDRACVGQYLGSLAATCDILGLLGICRRPQMQRPRSPCLGPATSHWRSNYRVALLEAGAPVNVSMSFELYF